jgi:hypothetical protein
VALSVCGLWWQALEAVESVAGLLHKAERDAFPVPADVADVVNDATRALFGVLVLHNHLGDACMAVAEAVDSGGVGRDHPQYPDVVKAWRTAHRVKRHILIRYQAKLLELRAEHEKKMKLAKDARPATTPAVGGVGPAAAVGAADDDDEAAEVPDIVVDRRAVYAEICVAIVRRCELLARVTPVPGAVVSAPPGATLARTASTETAAAGTADQERLSNEAAIQAWLVSQEAVVPLREASPEQRAYVIR